MSKPRSRVRTPRNAANAAGPLRSARRATPSLEGLEARALLATITVTSAADNDAQGDGVLTLREAIEVSNGTLPVSALDATEQTLVLGGLSSPAPNTVYFTIPGSGVQKISLTSALPAITSPIVIQGYSQNGSSSNPIDKTDVDIADPKVQIDGHALALSNPATIVDGLTINTPNSRVEGLIVTGFTGSGIVISQTGSQGNLLVGNFLGTLPDPTNGNSFSIDPTLSNLVAGVRITASNNRVGANSANSRNVIANNAVGLLIDTPGGTGNLVQNNFILDNTAQGVYVRSSNNTIGEALAQGGNVIAGNGQQGILITGGPTVQGNGVLGNEIGTGLGNVAGTVLRGQVGMPNGAQGILILDSPKNYVGADSSDAGRNVIGSNLGDGVAIQGAASTGNKVLDNYVGFDIVNGALILYAIPNYDGISVTASGNFIGDGSGGGGNTIGNNRRHGVYLSTAGAFSNTVAGNVIGLNPDGGSPFGNTFDGIRIDNAPNNTIGGTTAASRNVISSNNNGVYVIGAGATGNVIAGNFLGTAGDGKTDLGNAVDGVVLDNAPGNTIGGTSAGAGNVISGNNNGVRITGASATGNAVQGNFIGTDLSGLVYVHNEVDGVVVDSSNNAIGGLAPGAGNTIAFNAGSGVDLKAGTGNAVLSNNIATNTVAGIQEAGGADNNQPAPVLDSATPNGVTTNVKGTLNALPNTKYNVQFFASAAIDPQTGLGQGQIYLYTVQLTTDATGKAAIALDLPQSVTAGYYVTSTATDLSGNSSIFSNATQAVPIVLQFGAATYTASESAPSVQITVMRSGGTAGSVSVDYTIGGGTATPGTDYTAVSGTLTFNPGDPATKTFTVPLLDPKKVGGSVAANLTLANPTGGASLGNQSTAVLTVLDNDLPSVRLGAALAAVNENAGAITVTVSRNTTLGTSTVAYATSDGTAVDGVNYLATSGTITFNPGESSKTFAVSVLDDGVVRGPLKFNVALGATTNATLGAPATETVTVVNTDSSSGGATSRTLTIVVNTSLDDNDPTNGLLSLREAIGLSNGTLPLSSLSPTARSLVTVSPTPTPTGSAPPVPNTINFAIPGSGIQMISLVGSPLPAITTPLIINGYSEPGSSISGPDKTEVDVNGATVRIDGSALGAPAPGAGYDGIAIQAPDCEVNGLIVTGFSGAGMSISGAGSQGNWLWGNFLGALPDTSAGRNFTVDTRAIAAASGTPLGNLRAGLRITSSNNRAGGNSPGLPNVIANNGYDAAGDPAGGVGILIDTAGGTGNLIQGNAVFHNAAQGILVRSSNNTIGEAHAGGGNVIGGNGSQGVEITGGINVQGNQLLGNFLGTFLGTIDALVLKGEVRYANQGQGILILDSPKNTIGGYGAAARNVIGESLLDGIGIAGSASIGNRILNNYVGFNDVNGAEYFLPNQNGISISSPGNYVGDATGNGGNTIDNNRNHGILFFGAGASGNVVAGNVIGLNPGGGSAFNNAFDGIHLDNAPNNVIGGTSAASRNTISSNNNGVYVLGNGSTGNIIEGNFIGTAVDGVTPLGNAVDGVVFDNAPLNTVGGTAAGAGNVISGNNRGVRITGAGSRNNLVQGNFIGTDLVATLVVHNQIDGVLITAGASNNTVGGLLAGAGNTIDYNVGAGVNVDSGTGNAVLSNGVYDNTAGGIVLNPTTLANRLQPAPVLSAVVPAGSTTYVAGTINGMPNTSYTVQFFSSTTLDPSGFEQGRTFLFSTTLPTDATGHATIATKLPVAVPSGNYVTATATDALSDTSAYSNSRIAVPVQLQLGAAAYQVNETDGVVPISVTRTGGQGGSVAVDYSLTSGTAVAGTDYSAVTGTLFFNPGDPATKTFTIPILDAQKVGGSVNFQVNLTNPTQGATLGSPASAVVTVNDDDVAGIQIQPGPYTYSGAAVATFTIVRNTPSGTASVRYATSDGTAIAGQNYVPVSGTITFKPGETKKTVTVKILDDFQVHGAPLTFHLNLGNPVGAVLGPSNSVVATDVTTRNFGVIQFATSVTASTPGAGVVYVTVTRTGGRTGTVTVPYTTGATAGTARAGLDFVPASGTLTFGPGDLSQVIPVALLGTTTPGADTSFHVTIGSPGGGATIGRVTDTTVTIRHAGSVVGPIPGDLTPPTIIDLQPIAGPQGVYALAVTFSKAMDPGRAADVSNYGYFLVLTGPDRTFDTFDDTSVPIQAATYDAATRTTRLTLGSPVPLGIFARFVFDANTSVVPLRGLTDVSGNLLDGTGTGHLPGSPYSGSIAEGSKLSYTDRSGDTVSLSLAKGGVMTLRRGLDGEAQAIRLSGTVPKVSTLAGKVTRPKRGVGGTTTIPQIHGANGVKVQLRRPAFLVGGVSAAAVDRLSASGHLRAR